jgi:hypothetical protein
MGRHPTEGGGVRVWRVRVSVADTWELLVLANSKAMATKKAKAAVRGLLPSEELDLQVEHTTGPPIEVEVTSQT